MIWYSKCCDRQNNLAKHTSIIIDVCFTNTLIADITISNARLVFIGTVYALSGIGPLTSFASKLIGPKWVSLLFVIISCMMMLKTPDYYFRYPYSYTIATTAFLTCNLLGSLVSAPLTRWGKKPKFPEQGLSLFGALYVPMCQYWSRPRFESQSIYN